MIITVTVLPLLVVLSIGCWWQANAAKDKYTKDTVTYEQAVTSAFKYYQNSTDVSSHVKDIEDKLSAPLANKPQQPKLLFIGLTPPAASKKQADQLTASLTSVRDSFKNLHDLDAYGTDLLKIMSASTGTISTPTDMQNIKPVFQKAATDIQALKPPKGAETFHSQKVQAYKSLVTDIDTALSAYSKGDSTTYSTAVQKLATDAKAASPNAAAQQLKDMYDARYDTLAKDYDSLATLLGL